MRVPCWLTRVMLASAIIVGVSAVPATAFATGFKVPFTDPNQVGSLTLCNSHEQPITSGSLLSVPFVWRAVSSARVPAADYKRATLYLFQPLQYIDPGDWTSYQLTDDAAFSNPAHPMAQATYADSPLLWPDHSMPPYWDGMYQLRMVFSSPNEVPWTSTYPAAVIRVTGSTWTLVQGGGSSCTDGTAESVESVVLPKSETAVPKPPEKEIPYADTTKAKSGSKKGSTAPTTTSTTTTFPSTTSTTSKPPTTTTATTKPPTTTSPITTSTTATSATSATSTTTTTTTSPSTTSTTTKPPTTTTPTTTLAASGGSTTTTVAGGSSSRSALGGTSGKGGSGPSTGAIAAGAIAALVLAGAGALLVFRRRRLA